MGVSQVLFRANMVDELLEALQPPAVDLLVRVHPVGGLDAVEGVPPHADNLALPRIVMVEERIDPAGDLAQQRRHRGGPALVQVQPHGVCLVVRCDDSVHAGPVPRVYVDISSGHYGMGIGLF